jgi:hypothetical protein
MFEQFFFRLILLINLYKRKEGTPITDVPVSITPMQLPCCFTSKSQKSV